MADPYADFSRPVTAPTSDPYGAFSRPVAAGGDDIDVSSFGDMTTAKAAIDKLPEASRARARDKYADTVVAKEREGQGTVRKVADVVERGFRALPGMGLLDEFGAGISALKGDDYEMAHAVERARERAVKAAETPSTGKLPLVGEITAGGVAETVGTLGGALAVPLARVVPGVGAAATATNVGANAAALGGFEAATRADPGSRVEEGLKGALISGGVGAGIGAVAGRLANRGAPIGARSGDDVALAAEEAGVRFPVVAARDGAMETAKRQTAGGLASAPFAGTPLVRGADRAVDDMAASAGRVAEGYSPGGVTPATAGRAVVDTLADWVENGSAQPLNRLYATARSHIPLNATDTLPNTLFQTHVLRSRDAASGTTVNNPVIDMVAEAVTRPGGLTFEGMQNLRTVIGSHMNDALRDQAGTTEPGLSALYAALTADLRRFAQNHGPQAVSSWDRATRIAADTAGRRERIAALIKDGRTAPESIVDRLVDMAGSGRSADLETLELVRRTIGASGAWDDLAAAAVNRLGRNSSDDFSPAFFLRKYGALSDEGRNMLFSSTVRGNQRAGGAFGAGPGDLRVQLDALHTLAQRFSVLQRFQNPSGTGRAVNVSGAITSVGTGLVSPLSMVATVAGGNVMARIMARPIRVREVNQALTTLYEGLTRDDTLIQRGLNGLAQVIADETREDPSEVAARIMRELKKGAR